MRWSLALAIWLAMLVAAVLNGLLREAVLLKRLPAAAAQPLSAVLLASVVALGAYVYVRVAGAAPAEAWRVGVLWVALTVLFEFGFGLARGQTWEQLLAAYRFWEGQFWVLVLAVMLLAPWVMARVLGPNG